MPPTTISSDTVHAAKFSPRKDPVNLDHHLSATARRRKANQYKLFYKYYSIPGLQDISGGLPHESLFPMDKLMANAIPSNRLAEGSGEDIVVTSEGPELSEALQYGQATGTPQMQKWIQDFTSKYVADCLYAGGFQTQITMGSTDGWNKALQVLSNEWRPTDRLEDREGLLTEEFTYAIAAEVACVRGLNLVTVGVDEQGMIPSSLRETLAGWDTARGKRPHLLYTVSIGQNPTGATVPRARRQEIYDICCEYDVIIVEDEPYWFLQYDGEEKCYLSVDREGRVLRLDSFSKCFAPGCRMGWITGQPNLIRRIFYLGEEATQQPSGFTQALVYRTLAKWGHDGWMQWLNNLRVEYKSRRDAMVGALAKYAKVDGERVLEFQTPQAGMFVWTHIRYDKHPAFNGNTSLMAKAFWVWNTREPNPTLVNPGNMFAPDAANAAHTASYFRLSYAPSAKHDIAPFAESVGQATQSFWKLDLPTISELAADYPN